MVFATLCHQGFVIFIYFELSGFPLSIVYSLVVFAALCHQGFVMFIYFELSGFPLSIVYSLVVFATPCHQGCHFGFSYWWFSTFPLFCLFPGGFYHSEPPGPIFINDTSWTVSVGRIEVQGCLFGEFGVFECCRTDSSF